jgi:hypothetical protein
VVDHPENRGNSLIELFDMTGRLAKRIQLEKNAVQTRINLENLHGAYKVIWTDGSLKIQESVLIK